MKYIKQITIITVIATITFILGGVFTASVSAVSSLAKRLSGRILLQVESKGEAWYVDPFNLKRYYLGRAQDCFDIMREKGLGITNTDLEQIERAEDSKIPDLTQNWLTYNKNFIDENAGVRELTFKYPPFLNPYSEGFIPTDCKNCTATTTFYTNGPGFRIPNSIKVTQSQILLSIDKPKLGLEYQVAKSTTDNSLVTIKVIEHDTSKQIFQAIFTNQKSAIPYYKFEMGFIAYNDTEFNEAKIVFQEILNSVWFK